MARMNFQLLPPAGMTELTVDGVTYYPEGAGGHFNTPMEAHAKVMAQHGCSLEKTENLGTPAPMFGDIAVDDLGRAGLAQALYERKVPFEPTASRADLERAALFWNANRTGAAAAAALAAPTSGPLPAEVVIASPAAPAPVQAPAIAPQQAGAGTTSTYDPAVERPVGGQAAAPVVIEAQAATVAQPAAVDPLAKRPAGAPAAAPTVATPATKPDWTNLEHGGAQKGYHSVRKWLADNGVEIPMVTGAKMIEAAESRWNELHGGAAG